MNIEIIYVDYKTESILLDLDYVDCPVLWNKKGLFGLIPLAKIKNKLEHWKDLDMSGGEDAPIGMFYWRDVIPVSPQIANALLGEDKDDKCTYKGKGGPKSS